MNELRWPDGTPRSNGNAFSWRGKSSVFTTDRSLKHSAMNSQRMAGASEKYGPITTFVKAKAAPK